MLNLFLNIKMSFSIGKYFLIGTTCTRYTVDNTFYRHYFSLPLVTPDECPPTPPRSDFPFGPCLAMCTSYSDCAIVKSVRTQASNIDKMLLYSVKAQISFIDKIILFIMLVKYKSQ